jgi:predicted SpoU family rRNA methylase
MATFIMLTGQQGQGKTSSIRRIHPDDIGIIKAIGKEFAFPMANKYYKPVDKEKATGSVVKLTSITQVPTAINGLVKKYKKKVIFIDDTYYLLSKPAMDTIVSTSGNKFDQWAMIGYNFNEILKTIEETSEDVIIVVVMHTTIDSNGFTKLKYPGNLIDNYVQPEGLTNYIFHAKTHNNEPIILTNKEGTDTHVKCPIGMFKKDELHIPNDLKLILDRYQDYTGIDLKLKEFEDIENKIKEMLG